MCFRLGEQENFAALRARLDDDGKLYRKWFNKKVNAKKEGLSCNLTFSEYCQLVDEAGLLSSQLGFKGEGYVLARYDDKGDYCLGNCRFITQKENANERKLSEFAMQTMRENARLMNEYNKHDPNHNHLVLEGMKKSPYYIEKKKRAEAKKKARFEAANPNLRGSNNSQYGTYWITNGKTNIKWRVEKGDIPEGFVKGMTHKNKLNFRV